MPPSCTAEIRILRACHVLTLWPHQGVADRPRNNTLATTMRLTPSAYILAAQAHRTWKWAREGMILFQASMSRDPHALASIMSAHMTVEEILARRPYDRRTLYSLPQSSTAYDALQLMQRANITAVCVTAECSPADVESCSHRPLGLFTQTDFLRRVALAERAPRAVQLREVMTPMERAVIAFSTDTVAKVMDAMAAAKCHHVPVLTDLPPQGQLLAVVSMAELLGLTRALRDMHAARAASRTARHGNGATTAEHDAAAQNAGVWLM